MKKINVEIEVPDGEFCNQKSCVCSFIDQEDVYPYCKVFFQYYLILDEKTLLRRKCKECLEKSNA